MFFVSPSHRSLFGFDARVSAKRMRRRGEVTVSVSIFLVCMLERDPKGNPSSVLMGTSETAEKLGNKSVNRVCTRMTIIFRQNLKKFYGGKRVRERISQIRLYNLLIFLFSTINIPVLI